MTSGSAAGLAVRSASLHRKISGKSANFDWLATNLPNSWWLETAARYCIGNRNAILVDFATVCCFAIPARISGQAASLASSRDPSLAVLRFVIIFTL